MLDGAPTHFAVHHVTAGAHLTMHSAQWTLHGELIAAMVTPSRDGQSRLDVARTAYLGRLTQFLKLRVAGIMS